MKKSVRIEVSFEEIKSNQKKQAEGLKIKRESF